MKKPNEDWTVDVKQREVEKSDIELCYKAMGLSFSDNPERVEKTYRKLKDEYGKATRSATAAERSTATENLQQLEGLFTAIPEDSVTPKILKCAGKEIAKPTKESSKKSVDEIVKLANANGISGTPTMVMPDGTIQVGMRDAETMKKKLEGK